MLGDIEFWDIGLIGAGLVVLIWGADRFVHGAASSARSAPPLRPALENRAAREQAQQPQNDDQHEGTEMPF